MTDTLPIVEPLPDGQAWRRGDHSIRLTIQLRPADLELMLRLMAGTGARTAAFSRAVFQLGLLQARTALARQDRGAR